MTESLSSSNISAQEPDEAQENSTWDDSSLYRLYRPQLEAVLANWDEVRYFLVRAGIPGAEESSLANMQRAIIDGRLTVWMMGRLDGDGQLSPVALFTTTVTEDTIVGIKRFTICSLAGSDYIPIKAWRYGFKVLRRAAEREGCSRITAESNNKRVLQVVEKLGGDTSYHSIYMEV